jgi:regulator of chromosome condensation
MPPRRSSRAPSAKPVTPAVSDQAAPKPRVNGTSKRAASPERPASPPAKRSRSAAPKSENDPPAPTGRKPRSKAAAPAAPPTQPATKKARKLSPVREAHSAPEHVQVKPYFNPLPTPPPKKRPGLVPFAWGTGNFGQFGMGPDFLDEIHKPKRNVWAEEKIANNELGQDHGGMEYVVAGGLHTIFIDENGTVST